MNVDLPLIQSYWDDVKVVKVGESSSSREILEAVFAAFSDQQSANQLAFEDGGVNVRISAKWIRTEPSADNRAPRHTCITPISNAAQRTNDAVIRYLDQNDIVVNEVLDDASSQAPQAYPIHRTGDTASIDGSSQKALIATFSQVMGFHYSANTAISFPYAGIQVKALSNLLSFGNGRETLVDFGDLYGDAVNAIRETGMEIIQVSVEDGPRDILRRLLEAAGMPFTANPVFYGADRSAEFNTAITIGGILIPIDDGRSRLITELPIPELIGIFLRDKGIQLVQITTTGS